MTIKELLDAVATLGALGLALIGLYAYATGRIPSPALVQQLLDTIDYERGEKVKAQDFAEKAMESHDKMGDAIEERNRLDRERLLLLRQGREDEVV